MPDEFEFLAYFNLLFDCKLEEEKTILKLFKEKQGYDLSKRKQEVLDALIGTRLKFYQVNDQRGSRYEVEDIFQIWDLVFWLLTDLDGLELLVKFLSDDDPNNLTLADVQAIKKRLGYEVKTGSLLKDGVERILAEKMKSRDWEEEAIVNGILLWRDFQEEVDSWSGYDRSWAAAVEHILGSVSFNIWQPTQSELGEVYGVSANTISGKYQTIAETLGIEINNSRGIF